MGIRITCSILSELPSRKSISFFGRRRVGSQIEQVRGSGVCKGNGSATLTGKLRVH